MALGVPFRPGATGSVAWVLTIAHRRAVDRVRSEVATAEREPASPGRPVDEVTEEVAALLDAGAGPPLPAQADQLQRQSITLAYYRAAPIREVADALEVALGIKTRISDGLIRLRDCLGVAWDAGPARARGGLRPRRAGRPPSATGSSGTCPAAVAAKAGGPRPRTETATALGMAAAADPPQGLKRAVLAAIAALSSARAGDAAIAALLSAPDARTTSVATSAGGTATVISSLREAAIVFTSFGLRALPVTEVYELWFIGHGGARPAGLVPPPGDGGGTRPGAGFRLEPGDKGSGLPSNPLAALPPRPRRRSWSMALGV